MSQKLLLFYHSKKDKYSIKIIVIIFLRVKKIQQKPPIQRLLFKSTFKAI